MAVNEIPGLAHLPYAEVWFHAIDETRWREASAKARALAKTGLEVWTTDETPEVVAFLVPRGYEEVRHYVISELDVASAPDLGAPSLDVATLAERPVPAEVLYAIALESYRDQPGRDETAIGDLERWRGWGLDPHPPESYFVAHDGDDVLGYAYLTPENGVWTHGFAAVARAQRGRGVAGALKRAQVRWAKENGIASVRTATETRLVQMRALNNRFGYRPLYTEIVLRGPLSQD
ncbi:MAG TPA: GNAT family N-acetyltransferase [Gaiellaceae bacterium]|nr:GNAT family N-acetyltransferase [Gaiellaceae bacterium]